MKCFVSRHGVRIEAATDSAPANAGLGMILPCVTKLPKFLPTMQCHVAPFRRSNWNDGQDHLRTGLGCANLLLDMLGNFLEQTSNYAVEVLQRSIPSLICKVPLLLALQPR
jgi:hypothetical protein